MSALARFASWVLLFPLALSAACSAVECGYHPAPPLPSAAGGSPGSGGMPGLGGLPAAGAPWGTGGSGVAGATAQTKCQQACAQLARFGCPESQLTCVDQCDRILRDTRFAFDVDCRIRAKSKDEIKACGIGSCK